MKPLPDLGSSELRDLAAAISQDICSSSPGVAWGDVAGLEGAKHLLRETLVMPLQFPDIFTGILAPWKVFLTALPTGTKLTNSFVLPVVLSEAPPRPKQLCYSKTWPGQCQPHGMSSTVAEVRPSLCIIMRHRHLYLSRVTYVGPVKICSGWQVQAACGV